MSNDNAQKPTKAARERTAAYKGNARALGKHDKEVQDNFTMMQGFEWYSEGGGKHWNLVKSKAKELGEMGITAIWLPPPTKASSQEGRYDIYDLYDLGEFDQKGGKATKWGTVEEFKDCIAELKKYGVVVYIDAVLNHKAGADETETFAVTEVAEDDRNKEISGLHDIDGWTKFTFPGRKGKYSDFQWNFNHFTGVDWDDKEGKKGIFKIHGDGKTWAKGVDKEKGSFDYLMFADIDHAHPDVENDILRWGKWIIEETGAAGFRFDAVKHFSREFAAKFMQVVRDETDNPDMMAVGEFWKDSEGDLNAYLDSFNEQFSVFDTPLHYNFKEISDAGENGDLRKVFDGTIVQSRPMDAVTLVDNHDTQPTQALESWIDPTFKPLAYAFILWRGDGYPCVFLGDLIGCKSDPPVEPMTQLADFVKIRKTFSYGPTRDYWDNAQVIGWVREGDSVHEGCAVVMSIGTGDSWKRMQLPDGHAGEKWIDALGWYEGEVTIGDDGWADFHCHPRSVSCWVKKDKRDLEAFSNLKISD